jgi:ATP-dependent protease ClpP protease subunit
MITRFEFTAKAGGTNAEIYLYGDIGGDFLGDGITADTFQKELNKLPKTVRTIDLRIDSMGGSVFDARTIYTLLVQHRAKIAVSIDGLAASAASFIAMAGDSIAISEGGFVMIHEARGIVRGTAADMEQSAKLLRQINSTIVDTYAARTGASKTQLNAWMVAETWFTGPDAVKNGFADSLMENKRIAACARPQDFKNCPAALLPARAKTQATIERIRKYAQQ